MLDDLFGDYIFSKIWKGIRILGSVLMHPFFPNNYTLNQLYQKKSSGFIGLLFIVFIFLVMMSYVK